MKTSSLKHMGVAGALMGALAFSSCARMQGHEQTWTMNSTDRIPSAVGKVKVAEEKGGNTKVKVEVSHLAQPSSISDDASTYVVWLKPEAGPPQNVGVLAVNKDLKGSLETTTAFKDFQVLVTAERDPNVTSPSGQPVLNPQIVVPT
jgi:hypothetical protein